MQGIEYTRLQVVCQEVVSEVNCNVSWNRLLNRQLRRAEPQESAQIRSQIDRSRVNCFCKRERERYSTEVTYQIA